MNYVILSDTHHHAWSAFGESNAEGVNNRNAIIINETLRAADLASKLNAALIHAGDLFHVRGSIAPSVLNPVLAAYDEIVKRGVPVYMIPGNHDMEARESGRMTNAVTALEAVGVHICTEPTLIADEALMVPWVPGVDRLKFLLEDLAREHAGKDLVIHAPIDGVIPGLPDHGLTPEWLADLGFRRVFSGHYHHHQAFPGNVYSIGALTHQTWGDVSTKAGFLEVTDEGVKYHASHAPQFIDLNPEADPDEVSLLADGNYVRVRVEVERDSQVEEIRRWLLDCGAKGVTIHPIKKLAATSRTGATVSAGVSLGASVGEFIKLKGYGRPEDLGRLCQDILTEAEVVA